ncbi:crotonase/enoyl-CoA hydratase family protein [Streptomyces sp. P01-B04]|uniref:Crotonase/enoyl-CoA hydratase family protein n=2 Tax=Streptomyces TaxID=1883 RepID=A0ABY9J557_9ACTN|nr:MULTISPECIES: crotonase/enoyl-CoA hydratase family protein [Streptomyces]MBW5252859.1 crotonase/enoyl-CoA hydratase family protein [Streptomyces poriferorum]MBW5260892.1 crotonase/enoyl-CoA hydratase family protein [Streptomyces poriferorum]MDP5309441.1 crotonase/enoyl-CoA hydratase family protein [Streptomyces sp. Alt4]WLQ61363.1 crotonase/enoyl-CoA hydratase family protein [Streptomyces sp. Alt2]WSI60817.1 crotonase/enoyl-CoA hydratase family protein [Streptomyces sp. NBC_01336]
MNTEAKEAVVLTARREGVLVITLNRPYVRNAINQTVADAIDTALTLLETDPGLEVGVLTGAGGHFCSGMDLKAFPDEGVPRVKDRGLAGLTRAHRSKPLIAAVEGAAVAGGFELVLACDLITAADTAFFALPEVARGLIASEGGAIRLPARLPHHLAMEMLLTATALPAADAARHGLVNQLTGEGEALDAAMTLAGRIRAHSPQATRITRQVVDATRGLDDYTAFTVQDPLTEPVFATASAAEGTRAFRDKRSPAWSR